MRKEKNNTNLPAIILGIAAILALLLFVVAPVAQVGGIFNCGIQGYSSIFGITQKLSGDLIGQKLNFQTVNGVGISLLILYILTVAFSGFFSKYNRGFFIASVIVDIVIAILVFTYHSSWVKINFHNSKVIELYPGWGQMISGIIICVHAIGNLVAYKLAGNKR